MISVAFFSFGVLVGSVLSNKLFFHKTWKDSLAIGIIAGVIGFILMSILKLLHIL